MEAMLPFVAAMHPMRPDHVHEELELQLPDFSSYQLEWVARVPRWRDYYLTHDQTAHYAYLKTVLQILQWRRPGERWVLKSPQHLEQLGPLLHTFPDATIVVTHRDPVSVTASMATMIAYTARLTRDRVDVEGTGQYWADRLECMLRRCATDRDVLPPDQTIDVRFDEFMADDLAMVERVYELAGQPLDDRARASMAAFMAQHPRGRFGAVLYDLGDFGLEAAERRQALGFYTERFGVTAES